MILAPALRYASPNPIVFGYSSTAKAKAARGWRGQGEANTALR